MNIALQYISPNVKKSSCLKLALHKYSRRDNYSCQNYSLSENLFLLVLESFNPCKFVRRCRQFLNLWLHFFNLREKMITTTRFIYENVINFRRVILPKHFELQLLVWIMPRLSTDSTETFIMQFYYHHYSCNEKWDTNITLWPWPHIFCLHNFFSWFSEQ